MVRTKEYVELRDYYNANKKKFLREYRERQPIYKTYGHYVRQQMRFEFVLSGIKRETRERFLRNMHKVFASDWEKYCKDDFANWVNKKTDVRYPEYYECRFKESKAPEEHRKAHDIYPKVYCPKHYKEMKSRTPNYSGIRGFFRRILNIFN
jgi:hypothetical protein